MRAIRDGPRVLFVLALLQFLGLGGGAWGSSSKRYIYKAHDPELRSGANLDRSKRLREGVFEQSGFGVIWSDHLHSIGPESGQVEHLPIRGQESFDSSRKRAGSILIRLDGGVELIKPYEGVYVDYNLTSFSRFVSRIVEMELELHLTFKEASERRTFIRRRVETEAVSHLVPPQSEPRAISHQQDHKESLSRAEFQSLSFLFIAGYFTGESDQTGRERSLQDFVPVFHDNVTLSRQNANQYYAKYGITSFKDRLTALMSEKSVSAAHGGNNLSSEGKINVEQHKLSLLYLPHNDTYLFFSRGSGSQHLVLPKLHIRAIQTHQEAVDDDQEEKPSWGEDSNAKKVVVIAFLMFSMLTSFIILFYVLITWYIRGIQKHS